MRDSIPCTSHLESGYEENNIAFFGRALNWYFSVPIQSPSSAPKIASHFQEVFKDDLSLPMWVLPPCFRCSRTCSFGILHRPSPTEFAHAPAVGILRGPSQILFRLFLDSPRSCQRGDRPASERPASEPSAASLQGRRNTRRGQGAKTRGSRNPARTKPSSSCPKG